MGMIFDAYPDIAANSFAYPSFRHFEGLHLSKIGSRHQDHVFLVWGLRFRIFSLNSTNEPTLHFDPNLTINASGTA